MRRIIAGSAVCIAVTATLMVLPVYAAPVPEPEPVPTSVEEVELGSVEEPEGDAVVTTDGEVDPAGPQEDVATSGEELPGVPALTVSRPESDYFESVGITWRHDPAAVDVTAQVRVKSPDGTWGEWFPLETDDAVQRESAETADHDVRDGTAPYWTGPAHGIEAIVQAADGGVPEDVRVALIDPGDSAADALPEAAQPSDTAGAAGAMPRVYTRAEWGADESIRTWGPEYPSTIKAATIHHTADSNSYSAESVPAILRSMYTYHTKTRGWGDIGYNVIVDRYGRIFEGRYGGLTSTVVGAHAGGFNTFTFGVSMLGNYDTVAVPQATVNAVSAIVAWKLDLYGVDPRGTTVLTSSGGGTSKYAAGQRVTLPTVFAHRDVGSTACPGRYGYARMAEIRERVTTLSGGRTLLRSLTDTTVYLVSGSNRYPIPDPATLAALRPLGGVGYVADRYLAGFTEGPEMPRVVKSSTGTAVYFLDAGMKLRFTSCAQVADYGANCSSLVQLDQALIDAFATGPAITSLYRTTSGKAFYVSGGTKREVADDASLTAAGLPTSGVRLLESGLDYLPHGVPVVRNGITLRNRQTGAAAVAAGGSYTVLSPAVLEATAVSSWPVRDLDYASLRRLTISSAPGAFVREVGGSEVFLLTETGRREVTDASLAPVSVPQVPAALLAAFPSAGTLDAGTFLKGSGKGTIYVPDEGRRRPVLSWADLVALRGGGSGPILTVDQRLVDLLPTGPAQLGPASLVMSPAARTVYFVNGRDELIPLPSFNVPGELGASRLVRVTDADVAEYSVRTARLSTAIDCGGTRFLGLGGKRYAVGTMAVHYGLSYTSVDPLACAALPQASMGLTRFLRASTGTIYYIENGKKRPIRTYARYTQLGGTSANTIQTSDFALAQIPTGPAT